MENLIKLGVIIVLALVAFLIPAIRNFILGGIIFSLALVAYLSYTGSTLNWKKPKK